VSQLQDVSAVSKENPKNALGVDDHSGAAWNMPH
jgi:hypothetical protein